MVARPVGSRVGFYSYLSQIADRRVDNQVMRTFLVVLLSLAAFGAAAQKAKPNEHVVVAETILTTTGWASWYGWQFHGRTTANGETYNMHAMTAAHRTLPFDTIVQVSLVDSDDSVEVRINDRGPFVDDRIIDLSRASAKVLGMLRTGIAQVSLKVLFMPPPPRYVLQIGAFRDRSNAEILLGQLTRQQIPVKLEIAGGIFRVITEPTPEDELPAVEEALRNAGIGDWLRRVVTRRRCGRDPHDAAGDQTATRPICPDSV